MNNSAKLYVIVSHKILGRATKLLLGATIVGAGTIIYFQNEKIKELEKEKKILESKHILSEAGYVITKPVDFLEDDDDEEGN